MKGKEKFCMYAKKAMVPVLAIAMVLTATLLPIGAGSSDMYAYADDEATITLTAESIDQLNDTFVLSVNLTAIPEAGISAVEFKVDYPDVFDLVKSEDLKLMGESKKSTGFSSEYTSDKPYYIAFGSMDEEKAGVYTGNTKNENKTALAHFTFKAKAGTAAGAYEFKLTDINVIRLTATGDELPTSETVNVSDENPTCTYNVVLDNHDGEPTVNSEDKNVTVTVKQSGEAIPAVKTDTVRTAINQATASDSSTVTLDASNTTYGSNSIALTKTAAAEIATAGKSMTVKTQASDLTFDQTATKSIGADENGGEKLVIETKRTEDTVGTTATSVNALKYTVTAKLVGVNDSDSATGTPVTSFGGGEVEVSLDLPSGVTGTTEDPIECWNYDLKNHSYTEVEGTVTDSKFVFTTTHFSDYIVAARSTLNSFKAANSLTEGVKVSGKVKSYNPANATTINLYKSDDTSHNTVIKSTTIAADTSLGSGQKEQEFALNGVAAGTYDLVVSKPCHLDYTIKGVVVGSAAVDLTASTNSAVSLITLLAGDVTGDGKINASDLSPVRNNLMKTGGNISVKLADVTGDNKVNASDLKPVRENLMKTNAKCTVAYS